MIKKLLLVPVILLLPDVVPVLTGHMPTYKLVAVTTPPALMLPDRPMPPETTIDPLNVEVDCIVAVVTIPPT